MTLRRYTRTPVIIAGKKFGTSNLIPIVRENLNNGNVSFVTYVTKENERLDIIAGQYYNDGKLWWLIAAASEIGWGMQVPSNTILKLPKLEEISKYIN
jgi:chitinase